MTDLEKILRKSKEPELPIFVKWMEFLKWLLLLSDKMPKKVRFTFSSRMNNLALDLVEDLVEARYSGAKNKTSTLRSANLKLEKLRVLFRICHESKLISHDAYKHASFSINEVGKMLGGWLKHQEQGT